MILDADVLIAVDRDEPDAKDFAVAARSAKRPLRTTAPVVAQVWRDGSRQALLAQFLKSLDVLSFTPEHISLVGALLRDSRTSDVVDAHLLACAVTLNESIITADSDDFAVLASALGADAPAIMKWR